MKPLTKPILKSLICFSIIITLWLQASQCQAILLHGYASKSLPGNAFCQSAEPVKQDVNQFDCLIKADAGATSLPGNLDSNSFPRTYVGTWRCVSEVVDSNVGSVEVGQEMISNLTFFGEGEGKVVATWCQPGWTQTQAIVTTRSARRAKLERTNYYQSDGEEGEWEAISCDRFRQITANEMVAHSYVDQYVDSNYCGRYYTCSVLLRMPQTQDNHARIIAAK